MEDKQYILEIKRIELGGAVKNLEDEVAFCLESIIAACTNQKVKRSSYSESEEIRNKLEEWANRIELLSEAIKKRKEEYFDVEAKINSLKILS